MTKLNFEEKTTAQLKKHIKSLEHENLDEKKLKKEILAKMENDISYIDELVDKLVEKDASIGELGKENCQLGALVEN